MKTLFEEAIDNILPFWEVWQQVQARVPANLCSDYERPAKVDAIEMHSSRFSTSNTSKP
jgi:hypothetical protein